MELPRSKKLTSRLADCDKQQAGRQHQYGTAEQRARQAQFQSTLSTCAARM